jgi:hypothetical protein
MIRQVKFPSIFKARLLVRVLLNQECAAMPRRINRACVTGDVVKLKGCRAIGLLLVVSHFPECDNFHILRRSQKVV